MEPVENSDADLFRRLDLTSSVKLSLGNTDWSCGHCGKTLLFNAKNRSFEQVVFRCPYCFGFSQYKVASDHEAGINDDLDLGVKL